MTMTTAKTTMTAMPPMKTAWEKAAALYGSPRRLKRDVHRAAASGGVVVITPGLVLIGYEVPSGRETYPRPWAGYPGEVCDTWLVWAAAGDMREIRQHIPYAKKWIAFARRGRIRFYRCPELITRLPHE